MMVHGKNRPVQHGRPARLHGIVRSKGEASGVGWESRVA